MYGVGWRRLPYVALRIDGRYTKFSSSFGRGSYESVSFIRELGDSVRLELMLGQQDFAGALTKQSRSRFLNGQLDWNLGRHYYLSTGWLSYRGAVQNYDQAFVTLGYRF
ncbi:MAG: hypothetical protein HY821_09395 [Acidobacteria bacterium]|nr:hypothetical protein [Acidobacteriota bacterium]